MGTMGPNKLRQNVYCQSTGQVFDTVVSFAAKPAYCGVAFEPSAMVNNRPVDWGLFQDGKLWPTK